MDVIGDNMVTFRRNIKELNGNSKTEKYKIWEIRQIWLEYKVE